jgi:COMPASS component SWD2
VCWLKVCIQRGKNPCLTSHPAPIFQTAQELSLAAWTQLSFSPDGQKLLVTTRAGLTLVFESTYLQLERLVVGYKNTKGLDVGASFTPDNQYLLTGSEDGDICVFDGRGGPGHQREEGVVHKLEGHTSAVKQVLCNPKYEVVASACSNVVLWIPAS